MKRLGGAKLGGALFGMIVLAGPAQAAIVPAGQSAIFAYDFSQDVALADRFELGGGATITFGPGNPLNGPGESFSLTVRTSPANVIVEVAGGVDRTFVGALLVDLTDPIVPKGAGQLLITALGGAFDVQGARFDTVRPFRGAIALPGSFDRNLTFGGVTPVPAALPLLASALAGFGALRFWPRRRA